MIDGIKIENGRIKVETNEIIDDVTELIKSKTEFLDIVFDDGETTNPKDFEDDNAIHISRGKYRFVFYNGQEKNAFTESSVKRFSKLVDTILSSIK